MRFADRAGWHLTHIGVSLTVQILWPKANLAGQVNQMANLLQKVLL